MRKFRIALWLAVALVLFGLGAVGIGLYATRNGGSEATASTGEPGVRLGGAFQLVDQTGAPVTEAIFREKPSATLFGFTHCPDVCPTALMEMTAWAEALGGDAENLRFVFVTVDPERDTPEIMENYISAFSDRIVGVTGEPEAVQDMLADYKIYSRKVPLEGGDYTMDHTASVILQDADGNFVGTISGSAPRETAVAKLERLVAG